MSWLLRLEVGTDQVDRIAGRLWDLDVIGIAEQAVDHGIGLVAGFDHLEQAEAARAELGGTVERYEAAWTGPDLATIELGDASFTIESGRAFGHGHHPTTALALDGLSRWVRPAQSLLDVGTGTGVLAIAGAVLGASPVLALDTDQDARDAAAGNAAANKVDIEIAASLSEVPDRFDVVVANMLMADLEPVGPALRSCVGDVIILTGFLVEQNDRVIATLEPLTVIDRTEQDGWARLVMQ